MAVPKDTHTPSTAVTVQWKPISITKDVKEEKKAVKKKKKLYSNCYYYYYYIKMLQSNISQRRGELEVERMKVMNGGIERATPM